MFHISVINKGKDNVFGWNNKERIYFFSTLTRFVTVTPYFCTVKLKRQSLLKLF